MRRLAATVCALALLAPGRAGAAEPRTPRTPETPLSSRVSLSTPEAPRTPVGEVERPRAVQGGADAGPTPEPTAEPVPATLRERVAALWPGDDAWAFRIIECETGHTWDPTIRNRQGSGATGLFQIHPSNAGLVRAMGYEWSDMARVEPNLRVAWRIRQTQGRSAWVCN